MIADLQKVYAQVKQANLHLRRNQRPFKKRWQVILHYGYFFFLVHNLIVVDGDTPDKDKAFLLFCELCHIELHGNFVTFEQFERAVKNMKQ